MQEGGGARMEEGQGPGRAEGGAEVMGRIVSLRPRRILNPWNLSIWATQALITSTSTEACACAVKSCD